MKFRTQEGKISKKKEEVLLALIIRLREMKRHSLSTSRFKINVLNYLLVTPSPKNYQLPQDIVSNFEFSVLSSLLLISSSLPRPFQQQTPITGRTRKTTIGSEKRVKGLKGSLPAK
jgi:hypothetical protein